jgi:hypothetical protein
VTHSAGLADGETLERLWAYLRPFGSMTKEMTPSNRVELLADALQHYSWKERQKHGIFSYESIVIFVMLKVILLVQDNIRTKRRLYPCDTN